MRTFHIGGAASRAAVTSSIVSKSQGILKLPDQVRLIQNNKGENIVISRSNEIIVIDDTGRERERHKVPLWCLSFLCQMVQRLSLARF